jgi:hypothetical protein
MMTRRILAACTTIFFVVLIFSISCTKNANPNPPVHDTVTVTKHDTTRLTDTLYATKPDSTVNLKKGLLLYLPFSGNIADSSGNGNQTTAVGSVLTYDAHGYANNAFGATGNGERIYVTNNGSIQFDTAWSLSFGFMTNSVNAHQYYISMVDPVTGKAPSFVAGVVLGAIGNFAIGTEDVTLGCNNFGTNDNINITDTSSLVPVPGSWYNAVAIYHKGSVQVYINGKLNSTKTGLGTMAELCPASQIVIGGWWDGQLLGMNGKLDNIRLYNRVLTAHEIAILSSSYQVTSNGSKAGIITR